jgi:hypothetical protein
VGGGGVKDCQVFKVGKASTPGVRNFFCAMAPCEGLVDCTDPLSEEMYLLALSTDSDIY